MRIYTIFKNIIKKIQASVNVERITESEIDTIFGSSSGTSTNAQDYVVEHGTSGIWTYRKWASGIAECWGTQRHTITSWSGWGNLFEGKPIFTTNYPSGLFLSPPTINMVADGTPSNSGTCGLEIWQYGSASVTPQMLVLRPNSTSTNIAFNIHMEARGFWK